MAIPALAATAFTAEPRMVAAAQSRLALAGAAARDAVASLSASLESRPALPAARATAPSVGERGTLHRPSPRLVASPAVAGPVATRLPIAIAIENSDQLGDDSLLLVSNVPENAALLPGQPLGAGTWVVPAEQAGELGIIAYARTSTGQRLLFDLVSADGSLLSSAHAALDILQPARGLRSAAAPAAARSIRSAAVDWDARQPR